MKRGEVVCKSKLAYDSESLAQAGADFDFKTYGSKLRPYKCNFCPKYHLTSKKLWIINKKKIAKTKLAPKKKKSSVSAPWRKSYLISVVNWRRVPGDMREPKITIIYK